MASNLMPYIQPNRSQHRSRLLRKEKKIDIPELHGNRNLSMVQLQKLRITSKSREVMLTCRRQYRRDGVFF